MRFSRALKTKYGQYVSDLYSELEKLHELWYKKRRLEDKFPDLGDLPDVVTKYKADFYSMAPGIIDHIIDVFDSWVTDHERDGWWERSKEWFQEDGTMSMGVGTVDIRPCLLEKIERELNEQIDWYQEFLDVEFDYKADEFLMQKLNIDEETLSEKYDIDDEADARLYIDNLDFMEEYYEWAVKNEYFREHWDLEEIYGDDWVKENKDAVERHIDDCQDYAWEQWREFWPGYEEVTEQVKKQTDRLDSVKDSNDIDNIMSYISLALNTAHNSGLMYEHLDMTADELEKLSNLDTSKWDAELSVFGKKLKWSSGFKKN